VPENKTTHSHTLRIPLDASGIQGFQPDRAVKVAAFDQKGNVQETTVKLGADGKGTAAFSFTGQPGALRVVLGPESAPAKKLKDMQTISVNVSALAWQGNQEVTLPGVIISPYYWWRWPYWCRTFTITGRVVCPDGSPAPGAVVCAYDVDWFWWWISKTQVACATTDATGSFTMEFTWCCGWWPWIWWDYRFWEFEPLLANRILPILQGSPKVPRLTDFNPKPDLRVFEALLGSQQSNALTVPRTGSGVNPASLDALRSSLLENLPASEELARLRIWPWWPWWPWLDCAPDIIFSATQNCSGQTQTQTIINETIFDARWDVPTSLDVTLVSNNACCVSTCNDPAQCPDGDCMVITDACQVPVSNIGGNFGAPANPAGFANPGLVSQYGDQPFGGEITIEGAFGTGATVDYYEFEYSPDGGVTWDSMPPGAAGGFTRSFWGPALPAGPVGWHPVTFGFTPIGGHNVIESRQHFEANNDPSSWGVTRIWETVTQDYLMEWLTDGLFTDGTYQLRVRSWQMVGGVLQNDQVLPQCDTDSDNSIVLTLDNRYVSGGPTDAYGQNCGTGSVHTCTTEPSTDFVAVTIASNLVQACDIIDATKLSGSLIIDFMAYDPDGHLGYFALQATYGTSGVIDLISKGTLTAGAAYGGVPSAAQVGPDYGTAIGQGAVSPIWNGGMLRLTITDLKNAFPEPCCYQLQLYAHKRTIVDCDGSEWEQVNLSEYSFTVLI
jgi:hypothetical protein